MDNVVAFQSPGIIDYRCITTIGASVKEGENPIGFFGTGLKYAIAIILRHGGTIDIYRGAERLAFTTKNVLIRRKQFPVICMNGKEMGFTIELGKTWSMWQAFREIFCNTVDEGGKMELGALRPQPGTTTVLIQCPEFVACAREKHKYFLESIPLFRGKDAEFHAASGGAVYYRKVFVHERKEKPFRYTVNLLAAQNLTEDRTLYDSYGIQLPIANALMECQDRGFVEDWLTVGEDYAEYGVDLFWGNKPSALVAELGLKAFKDPMLYPKLNRSVRNHFKAAQGEPEHAAVKMLPHEKEALLEAEVFCNELGYTVEEYPVTVVETLGEGVLGQAHVKSKKIWLSRTTLAQGKLCIAATLIEEWCHIKHRHMDCSRGMQNWLLENMVRLGAAYLHQKGV